jgi:hypothetical protein
MKVLLCKVWSVTDKSVEDAVASAQEKGAVVYGAEELRTLPHPVHLAEVDRAFGAIGAGGKVPAADREDSLK